MLWCGLQKKHFCWCGKNPPQHDSRFRLMKCSRINGMIDTNPAWMVTLLESPAIWTNGASYHYGVLAAVVVLLNCWYQLKAIWTRSELQRPKTFLGYHRITSLPRIAPQPPFGHLYQLLSQTGEGTDGIVEELQFGVDHAGQTDSKLGTNWGLSGIRSLISANTRKRLKVHLRYRVPWYMNSFELSW